MRIFNSLKIAGLLVLLFFSCNQAQEDASQSGTSQFYKPWEVLGPFFHEVQMAGIYPDSKTFVDCIPKRDPRAIAEDYDRLKGSADFDLKGFVLENFEAPAQPTTAGFETQKPFAEHLQNHWAYLTREPGAEAEVSTLIPLPEKYVVPGGRFREIYYWDSYFTMIGLGASARVDLVKAMLDNFAFLVDSIGFTPNGNRTYYLGRSQPPYFSSMVNLYMQLSSEEDGLDYLSAIQKEYDFWMKGMDELTEENLAIARVVLMSDGTILNRYWDNLDFPRPESHKEDFELAESLDDAAKKQLYRNLRAGAESGWDYSTRWFADKGSFASIQTTDILPVDLNCLMYQTETMLEQLYNLSGDTATASLFNRRAFGRKQAIQQYFWDASQTAFTDFLWKEGKLSTQLTLAGAYPLYFNVASEAQAEAQAEVIERDFLLPGGLVTTTIESGQQWDYPNGWAPLQWIAIKGLEQYGQKELAVEITSRWLNTNQKVFDNTGKMMEKYNVSDTTLIAGGGEYPTQDGFGWTNGVALGLLGEEVKY